MKICVMRLKHKCAHHFNIFLTVCVVKTQKLTSAELSKPK